MLANYKQSFDCTSNSSKMGQTSINHLQISQLIPMKETFDCGVQANLDYPNNPESEMTELDDTLAKKRHKRKQYKKRKKLQQKIMQRQNKDEFKYIIDLFYQRQGKFIDYSDRLEQLVCSFNQNQFKNIFDSILKQRVMIIQNSIWEYTQAILQENPLEMRHDHSFYLEMVDQIFKYYKLIEKASQQAEQVIYIYLTLNSKDSDEPITPQDLGRRTFRYLIQTDETLRKLLHMCDKKISYVRVQQRQKLQILITKLKNFRERFENNIFDDDQEDQDDYSTEQQGDSRQYNNEELEQEEQRGGYYEDEKSTTFSENQLHDDEQENNQMDPKHNQALKKKRKRKIKVFESKEDKLSQFFESLTFDLDKRDPCNIDEQQLQQKTKIYFNSFKKSFQRVNQFDIMRVQLEKYSPCRRLSKQYRRLY